MDKSFSRQAAAGLWRSLVAATVVFGIGGCSAPPKAVERAPTPVAVLKVVPQDIPLQASLSGTVSARVQQDLSFRTGGRIADLSVDVGAHVVRDQVLGHLDPHELQANADLAAASVTSAEAQVTEAQSSFDRQNALFAQGNTTRANLDAAQTAVATAKGAVDAAKAQAASAQETVGYAELRASADGIIVARAVEAGQVVSAAQPVFAIAEDGARDVVFSAFEQALTGVPRDASVSVALLSDASVKATGHVREYSPTLDSSNGTVRIKVALDAGSPDMPLGAAAMGSVSLPPLHGFALPWSALFRDENGPAVWMIDPAASTVSLKPVVVDRYLDDTVVVSAGLNPGDVIVATGLQLLRPGEKVTARAGTTP